jgi:hypothetical protein
LNALRSETCEYCSVTKPITVTVDIKNSKGKEESENIFLMVEFIGHDGDKAWMCQECYTDIENKGNDELRLLEL